MDEMGILKGALGIRYLIKYFENGRVENFKVVRDCLNEVRLWFLITFYTNNIDYLMDDIPEFLLTDVFQMKDILIGTSLGDAKEADYGRGFQTRSTLSYKEQFKLIRDALSHGKFQFKDNLIHVSIRDYEAIFDLAWLDRLTTVILSNDRLTLKKGMSDYSVISLMPDGDFDMEKIKEFIRMGTLAFYQVTSLTSNPDRIKESIKNYDIDREHCTFDFIFKTAIYLVQRHRIDSSRGVEGALASLKKYFSDVESYFGNAIKLELVPLTIPDDLCHDKDFLKLSYAQKLEYLITLKKEQDPIRYNSLMVTHLFQLLDEIDKEQIQDKTLVFFRDSLPFLIKAYAMLCFIQRDSYPLGEEELRAKGANATYVHAKNVYKEYIRVLHRSLRELRENNGPLASIQYVLEQIKIYSHYFDEASNNFVYKDFFWRLRNSIVHDQVEFQEDKIRFFTTGRNIKVRHFNKKKKEWEYKDFVNQNTIWEMIIRRQDFISLLDELFMYSNIPVSVNISKYCKRSTYLK